MEINNLKIQGLSLSAIVRQLDFDRKTVRKSLQEGCNCNIKRTDQKIYYKSKWFRDDIKCIILDNVQYSLDDTLHISYATNARITI